jgi:L-2-hydroxyglutarate oxidase
MTAAGPRYAVVGGGILGLAVADRLLTDRPGAHVTVLEKEQTWAAHQTGRNSGVIHSGLYYPPGSAKSLMCRAGARSMVAFAQQEGIAHRVCGKHVVATRTDELARLDALYERGKAGRLTVRRLSAAEAREHEPHVAAVAALHVAETGVIDYGEVCAALVRRLGAAGADLRLGAEVLGAARSGSRTVVRSTSGDVAVDVVVNCAGLQSDLVARRLGGSPTTRIVPFRGEYHELPPGAAHLVRGLVSPVPDPRLPVPRSPPHPGRPRLGARRLVPAPPGVRAQALNRDGTLVDDFLIERDRHAVHVLNATSPAATSVLEIARHVVSLLG